MAQNSTVHEVHSKKNMQIHEGFAWQGDKSSIVFTNHEMHEVLSRLDQPVWIFEENRRFGCTNSGQLVMGKEFLRWVGLPR